MYGHICLQHLHPSGDICEDQYSNCKKKKKSWLLTASNNKLYSGTPLIRTPEDVAIPVFRTLRRVPKQTF